MSITSVPCFSWLRPPGRVRPAQQRAHARDEFVGAERLGDVVVGAELEPDDAVGLFGAGGQHDDRQGGRGRIGAERTADLEAVEAREHQIEQQEIRLAAPQRRQHVGAARNLIHRKARAREAAGEEHRDIGVVFDDEHTCGLTGSAHEGRGANSMCKRLGAFNRKRHARGATPMTSKVDRRLETR